MSNTEKKTERGRTRFVKETGISISLLAVASVGVSLFLRNNNGRDNVLRMALSIYPSLAVAFSILLLVLLLCRGVRHRNFKTDRWEWLLLTVVACSGILLRASTVGF